MIGKLSNTWLIVEYYRPHPHHVAYPQPPAALDVGREAAVPAHGIVAARPQPLLQAQAGVALAGDGQNYLLMLRGDAHAPAVTDCCLLLISR